eukprot:TRINITY_DN61892_c0_g1_i1.p1 TRINITY_DN61892_c0_g1~~TRINITY_DN61892_c0_g1_i1.p1  ORF type:complete len:397 (+),score=56.15 TRINITY_DN61892_c0_g1_i1:131-1192(+)
MDADERKRFSAQSHADRDASLEGKEDDGGDSSMLSMADGGEEQHGNDEREDFDQMLDFQDSVYDLAIQYSCLAVHGSLTDAAGYANLVCVMGLQALNLFLQMNMLKYVRQLIMFAAVHTAATSYTDFQSVFYGRHPLSFKFTPEGFHNFESMSSEAKSVLCQFPLVEPAFFVVILLIWTFFLGHELKQTVFFAWQTFQLPSPTSNHIGVREVETYFVVTHMSFALKVWISIAVFLPKFTIALALWTTGARWLSATSGFEDLVLNALALTFICDLDELIFRACVPEATKRLLTTAKLPLASFTTEPTYRGPSESFLTAFGCFGITIFYIFVYQDVFPNFQWDLSYVCETNREGH